MSLFISNQLNPGLSALNKNSNTKLDNSQNIMHLQIKRSLENLFKNSNKKEKTVYEEWGLETASDANGPTLKEFSNIIKQLL